MMFRKFPQIPQFAETADAGDIALFRIDPEYISLLDYTKGFGHTDFHEVGKTKTTR